MGFLAKPPAHPVTNLAAWFTVVASNRLRDAHRSAAAQRRALERMGTPVDATEDAVVLLDRDVLDALRRLPLHQRQVCALHYLMDQSIETIAEGLGVSEGTVKTQLHRARKALASRLRKEDHLG